MIAESENGVMVVDANWEVNKPAHRIDNDGMAEWYLEKLAAIDNHIAVVKAQAEAKIKRAMSDRQDLINLYGAELEHYVAQKVAEDKRGRKSVIFLTGTCSFRTVPSGLRVTDEKEALEAARGIHPDYNIIQTREVLDTTAFREYAQKSLEMTGVLWPGCEVVPERQSFSIKFGKDKE